MTHDLADHGSPAEPRGRSAGRSPRRYLFGGAAAACAVCCAPPVLALVGLAGSGLLATAATLALAGSIFALVVAAVSATALITRTRTRGRSRRPRGTSRPTPPEPARRGPSPLPDPVRRRTR